MFKQEFKYYKAKKPPPDLSHVYDFRNENYIKQVKLMNVNHKAPFFGLKPTDEWKVYELSCHPGLIFIVNPFNALGQLYFSIKCLQDYTKVPNKSNLDNQNVIGQDEDWWSIAKTNLNLQEKMRWITFGYHHNWDTKVYREDSKSPFPKDLSKLCNYIASVLNFDQFQPEAAIVNYYHMDSTLSGHTDHSEDNLEAPLFSFSFGQSAIFLLGGKCIDEKPTAMFINSGDVIIMSKESRLCYHGVPKIIPNIEETWNLCNNATTEDIPDEFDSLIIKNLNDSNYTNDFKSYLRKSRININIRQVLKREQKRLFNS